MSDLIYGSIIGAISALAGVIIAQSFGYLNRKSEEKRWYAGHFLELKIEALKKLQITLEECNKMCRIYGNIGVSSFEDYRKEILPKVHAYRDAIRMAIIYLEKDEKKIFEKALGEFRKVISAIDKAMPLTKSLTQKKSRMQPLPLPNVENWDTLLKAYNESVDCMRNLLNPVELKKYIEKI